MCFGGTKAKNEADLKAMQERKAQSNNNDDSLHKDMMKAAAGKRKNTLISRPKPRSNNAYTSSGAKHKQAGKRFNPSLLQRILDKNPTYNLVSSIGRKFDPRG